MIKYKFNLNTFYLASPSPAKMCEICYILNIGYSWDSVTAILMTPLTSNSVVICISQESNDAEQPFMGFHSHPSTHLQHWYIIWDLATCSLGCFSELEGSVPAHTWLELLSLRASLFFNILKCFAKHILWILVHSNLEIYFSILGNAFLGKVCTNITV